MSQTPRACHSAVTRPVSPRSQKPGQKPLFDRKKLLKVTSNESDDERRAKEKVQKVSEEENKRKRSQREAMTQDIVYIIGIIIAILLLMLFLRSILLRRQRLAAAQAANLQFAPSTWQFRGDHGMDVVRPEPAVTNLSTLPGITRTRTQDSDSRDQLPRYEAPPPGYDAIVKDLERGDAAQVREGEERGEPSRTGPPGYNSNNTNGAGDEAVVVVSEAPTEVPGPTRASSDPAAVGQEGLFRINVRRAWSGLGR